MMRNQYWIKLLVPFLVFIAICCAEISKIEASTGQACGDGVCESPETCEGCAADCGACVCTAQIAVGDTWRYLKGVQEPPGDWTAPGFDDTAWLQGATGIGYGDSNDATVLTDMMGSYASVYLRNTFPMNCPSSSIAAITLEVAYDDAFVAYLNGTEIARANITGTPPAFDALSDTIIEDAVTVTFDLSSFRDLLVAGDNVLAIQVHNRSLGSSDLDIRPALVIDGGGSDCGDGVCDGNESCSSCEADCGACPPVCGDGVCESPETCVDCEADCGACPPVCGDGTCDAGEDCNSCPQDCDENCDPQGDITAAIEASRTQNCVAPCAVFFEATGTTHTDPAVRPFHDLQYQWSFGDPQSGQWGLSGYSRNNALGPVTAHVFETAGLFTVTLNVRDQAGNLRTASVEVEVDDPDVVFAGSSTRCVSPSGDFGLCPGGASQEQSADFDAQIEWVNAQSGRRLLFHRGETYDASAEGYVSIPGPGLIGAYGTCQSPDDQGMCSNAPHINAAAGEWAIRFSANGNVADWRVMDLEFDGAGAGNRGIGAGGGSRLDRLLVMRMHIHDFTGNAVHINYVDVGTDARHQELAIHASRFHDVTSTGMWLGADRLSLQGIDIRRPASHTIRIWAAKRATISHNDIDPTGEPHSGQAIKLHNCDRQPSPHHSFVGPCTDGEYIVISDNRITGVDPWTMGIGPESANIGYRPGEEGAQRDELVSDVIVERNRFVSTSETQLAIKVMSPDTTVRNNLFDGRGASPWYSAVDVQRGPPEGPVPHGASLLGNTMYFNGSGYLSFARIGQSIGGHPEDYAITNVQIQNNVVSGPGVADAIFMEVYGETELSSMLVDYNLAHLPAGHHVFLDTATHASTHLSLSEWQSLSGQGIHSLAADPLFDDPGAGMFGLQSTSPGANAGAAIPVFVDLDRQPRSMASPDLGAVED
jgi:hypothetical protein